MYTWIERCKIRGKKEVSDHEYMRCCFYWQVSKEVNWCLWILKVFFFYCGFVLLYLIHWLNYIDVSECGVNIRLPESELYHYARGKGLMVVTELTKPVEVNEPNLIPWVESLELKRKMMFVCLSVSLSQSLYLCLLLCLCLSLS